MGADRPGQVRTAMARSEETRLVERARRGNAEAFRLLVETYKERLFAFIWRMVRDHHDAEDLTQAAFVRAYEALKTYSDRYAFSTWLFTIAYRLCLNYLRKRKAYSGEVEFGWLRAGDEDATQTLANSEEARRLRRVIWNAVDQLKPAQRSAVLLFYREGKSCEEISQVLNIPTVTVKSHLHRARAKLREALSAELVEDWMSIRFAVDGNTA